MLIPDLCSKLVYDYYDQQWMINVKFAASLVSYSANQILTSLRSFCHCNTNLPQHLGSQLPFSTVVWCRRTLEIVHGQSAAAQKCT